MKRLCVLFICLFILGMAGSGWTATWYVDRDVRFSGGGTSWSDAFKTIQEGIDVADGVTDEVWVMAGTYYLTAPIDVDKYVLIYGGFGGWELAPSERDLRNNVTIVDGRNSVGCFYIHEYAHIDGFTITHGNAYQGGGIRIDADGISPPPPIEIFNCTFVDNSATNNGGGIYNEDCALWIDHCTFSGNIADDGAGIYSTHNLEQPEAMLAAFYCTFLENSATGDGGGVFNNDSFMSIVNSIFAGNSAGNYGGAIFNIDYSGPHDVTACSFWGNTATWGGGIANISTSPYITDCIFWGDTATNGSEIYNESSSPVVDYCDVEGGTGEPWFGPTCIDSDPFFIDPENGDFHLGPYSPCIDTGTGVAGDDFEGDARPQNGEYDMGADEASILYASPHGTGLCTEGDPCDLQTALTLAQSNVIGDFVCLEPGIYDPNESFSGPFFLYSPFEYGQSGNENYFIGLVGSPYANGPWDVVLDGGGVSQVLYMTSPADLRIQKVTIKNGGGNASDGLGGGVYAACNGTLTIKDCIISDCTVSSLSDGEPVGGGIYASAWEKIIFDHNRVSGNSVLSFGDHVWGGGAYLNSYGGQIIVKNNVIMNNWAMSRGDDAWGGGLCIPTYAGDALLTNNIIAENTAESLSDDSYGGGIYLNHAEGIFSLINNTIVSNQAKNGRGGGLYFSVGPPTRADFYNNIIWGNTASSDGNDIFNEGPGALYLYYNDYHDVAGPVSGADDNIDVDPQFINGYYGEYHLAPGSACIDAGTDSAPDLPMIDRDGDPRLLDAAPDMGADEAHILYVSPGGTGNCKILTPCSLQTALTIAQDNGLGDLLSLSAGTYDASSGTFTYIPEPEESYPLMMMGEPGTTPDQVILDGGGMQRVLDLFDAQCMIGQCTSDFVVQGLTIQNGYQSGEDYDNGGGMRCVGRTHFIAENIIDNNTISGLYYAHGGGICAIGAETSICNNLIMDNEAGPAADVTGGGGVALAPGYVIGMPPLTSSRATLRDNTFLDNAVHTAAEGYGGGARLFEYTAVINNVFSGNSVNNILTARGGGVVAGYRNVLTHNTIAGNSATALSTSDEYGGGLVCNDLVEVYNNIVWGNTASGNGDDISLWGPDIYGFNNDYYDLDGTWVVSAGNIDQDPFFVDGPGGDFHLQPTSPCIDVGHNGAPRLPAYDFEGDPRVINDVPDMGVDEVRLDTESEGSSTLCLRGLDFGTTRIGVSNTMNLIMKNSTDADIDIGTATNPALPYTKTGDWCSDTTLQPGDICTIIVQFAPTTAGTFDDSFQIPTNDPMSGMVTVSLSGIGVTGSSEPRDAGAHTLGPWAPMVPKSSVSGSVKDVIAYSPSVVEDSSPGDSTAPVDTPKSSAVDAGQTHESTPQIVISSLPPASQQELEENLLLEEGESYDVMSFGEVKVGASDQLRIILSHEEGGVIKVGDVVLPSAPYCIVEDKCSGTLLGSGSECAVTVQFSPPSANNFYDYFLIPTDDPHVGTLRVKLEGKGISE